MAMERIIQERGINDMKKGQMKRRGGLAVISWIFS